MFATPAVIAAARPGEQPIEHQWHRDSWVPASGRPSKQLLAVVAPMSARAQLALMAAIMEWLVHRFAGQVTPGLEPGRLVAAGWAMALAPAGYFKTRAIAIPTTPEARDTPVTGPLWQTARCLREAHFQEQIDNDPTQEAAFAVLIARRVMAPAAPFERWLDAAAATLRERHPRSGARGVPVPREVLFDLPLAGAPEAAAAALFAGIEVAGNPFLVATSA